MIKTWYLDNIVYKANIENTVRHHLDNAFQLLHSLKLHRVRGGCGHRACTAWNNFALLSSVLLCGLDCTLKDLKLNKCRKCKVVKEKGIYFTKKRSRPCRLGDVDLIFGSKTSARTRVLKPFARADHHDHLSGQCPDPSEGTWEGHSLSVFTPWNPTDSRT